MKFVTILDSFCLVVVVFIIHGASSVAARTTPALTCAFAVRRRSNNKQKQQIKQDVLQDLEVDQKTTTSPSSSSSAAGMTNLRFQASTNYATQPVEFSTDHGGDDDTAFLVDFFLRDKHRDMLLAGEGSKNRVQLLQTPDVELYRLWNVEVNAHNKNRRAREQQQQQQSQLQLLQSPVVGDAILRVTTTGIHFPGLTLRTIATVGCKTVVSLPEDEDSSSSSSSCTPAQLQITLIDDELEAEGPEPLVWIFHKLTGTKGKDNHKNVLQESSPFSLFLPRASSANNNNKPSAAKRRTHSTNIITAEKITTKDKNTKGHQTTTRQVVFRSVVSLGIEVNFPSFLLNMLPVSKKMAEEQGSKAIYKVVNRDIGPSLEALRQRYIMERSTTNPAHQRSKGSAKNRE